MNARTVLDAALAAGFMVECRGEKLHVQPTPPPDLIERIRAHKPAILELLRPGPEPELDAWLKGEPYTRPAAPIAWVDRPDVVTVVEDLADEGWRPRRISRTLGLTRAEVFTVLRRTGR
jgi:hypothetical protein